MDEMFETIRIAVADGATADQKVAATHACRTILAALEAEAGKPIALAGAPPPSPLAGISPDQALDLLIARLSALVPSDTEEAATAPRSGDRSGLRFALVRPPAQPRRRKNC